MKMMKKVMKRSSALSRAVVEGVERRVLFAFDVQFLDAVVPTGTYSPGDIVSSQITFRNNGDTASPATKFLIYLAKPGFFDGNGDGDGDPSSYGGVLYLTDDSQVDGLDLPAIGAGQTITVSLQQPMGSAVFNGGPYNLYVFAGFNDSQFILGDSDFSNNLGLGSQASVTVTGGFDLGGGGNGGGQPTPVVGGFDTDFGGNGTGVQTSTLAGAAVQTIATVFDPSNGLQYALAQRGTDIVVLRFDTFGNLDTTYGGDGTAEVSLGGSAAKAAALVWLGDGRVAVGGSMTDGSAGLVAVLAADGSMDGSFGSGGVAMVANSVFGGVAFTATSLAKGNSGEYFLGGGANGDFAVAKVTAGGQVDGGFGGDGGVVVDLGGTDVVGAVAVTSKGQVVLGGGTTAGNVSSAVAVRLNANGSQDTKFGSKGTLTLRARAGASEQITVAGVGAKDLVYFGGYSAVGDAPSTTSQAFVSRVTSAGKVDTKWGTKGISLLTQIGRGLATPNTLNVTSDGGVLLSVQTADSLAGAAAGAVGAVLVRLDSRGLGMANFGTSGIKEVIAPGITLAAAPDTEGAFQDFLANKEGTAAQVPGGKVRTLASQAAADGSSTTLQVAQLFADGADIAPVFEGALPANVQGGAKGTVKLKVSNLGTLDAVGSAGMTLTLVPVGTGTPISGSLGSANIKLKLKPGASAKSTAKITFPAAANGLYAVVANVTPSSQVNDIGTSNNSTSGPNQVTIAPKASQLALALAAQPGPLTAGKVLAAMFTVMNSGNNKASGKAVVQMFIVDGTNEPAEGAAPVATASVSLGTNPGATQLLKASFKVPVGVAVGEGQRLFFKLVVPEVLGDTNESDDSVFSDVLVG